MILSILPHRTVPYHTVSQTGVVHVGSLFHIGFGEGVQDLGLVRLEDSFPHQPVLDSLLIRVTPLTDLSSHHSHDPQRNYTDQILAEGIIELWILQVCVVNQVHPRRYVVLFTVCKDVLQRIVARMAGRFPRWVETHGLVRRGSIHSQDPDGKGVVLDGLCDFLYEMCDMDLVIMLRQRYFEFIECHEDILAFEETLLAPFCVWLGETPSRIMMELELSLVYKGLVLDAQKGLPFAQGCRVADPTDQLVVGKVVESL